MSRYLAVLMALLIGVGAGFGWNQRRLQPLVEEARRGTALLQIRTEENERLRALVVAAENDKALARNKTLREAVEREVTGIRGLAFKTAVDYQVLGRKEIKAVLSGKLNEVFSEQEFRDMAAALARLGLLEAGYPLREKYIDLLGEQVAAFYDQHQHKLFMFADASLENAQNRVVLAHELTHALQDQHFGLGQLPLEIKTNDDRAIAASSLCEGDATLVMTEYMLKNLTLGALKDNVAASLAQNMDQLAAAPRYLRELLVFPYLRGQEFCAALSARGGYEAINKAYAAPPSSSTQILHPEKLLNTPREEPLAIEWSDLLVLAQKPIVDNVLGEIGIRILVAQALDDATGERAASGWRADRYLAYDGGKSLVWKTIWANEQEAAEFADAQRRVLEKRYAKEPGRVARCLSLPDNAVLVIDAADEAWGRAIEERFGQPTP